MSDFTDEFAFRPRKSGKGLVAEGDWHGDEVTLLTAGNGTADEEMAVLDDLHRHWRAWRSDLVTAIEDAHGDPGDYWVEAITANCGGGRMGYFEIEFSAPDLFDDEIGLAVGTIKGGIDSVSASG